MGKSPMLYKNVVLLDLFLYSTFLAFTKSIVKVSFISLLAQRNETKKCGSHAAGPLMPHKAANFIHECVR